MSASQAKILFLPVVYQSHEDAAEQLPEVNGVARQLIRAWRSGFAGR